MEAKTEKQLSRLISAQIDERLDAEGRAELDGLLKASKEARDFYRRVLNVHFALLKLEEPKEIARLREELPDPEEFPQRYGRMKYALRTFQSIAAVLAVAFGALLLNHRKGGEASDGSREEAVLARIYLEEDVVWSEQTTAREGEELRSGMVEILEGKLSFRYENGATIALQGPARFELESGTEAFAHFGKIAAKFPTAARGFLINSPQAAVVDLGTEYALNVDGNGVSEVMVYEGEVTASVLGEDGYTLRSIELEENESAKVDGVAETISEIGTALGDFIRIHRFEAEELPLEDGYRASVLRSKPVAYWRFDDAAGNEAASEVGGFRGRFSEGVKLSGLGPNRALHFPTGVKGNFIAEEAFEGINRGEYSIEFWVNLATFDRMALVSLVSDETKMMDGAVGQSHLSFLEAEDVPYDLKHKPQAFRFLHRYPVKTHGRNAFTSLQYAPGRWYYLAAVKRSDRMQLYVDGVLAREVEAGPNSDESRYRLVAGQLDAFRKQRNFNGKLDELAVYDRALEAGEIEARFREAMAGR